jgi:lipid II:glycine glycyltransferase (peptidoglycan interpeptide bridge formation enzyme)
VIGATLAYVPEGPTWTIDDPATLASALDALADHVAARRAFALTVGPTIWWRRWHAATVKAALAGPATRFAEVDPDEVNPTAPRLAAALSAQGWRPPEVQNGFGAGQPDYVFQLPLAGRDEAQILAGFNQLWRRNIRKAEAAGVEVTRGARADFPAFHALYQETAARDHFTPRPLAYFEGMWDHQTAEDPDRLGLYLARQGETLVAAAVTARVPGQTWYVYGASATEYRDVRGSNALQWAMVRDAIVHEDALYDLRGITDTTDRADPHAGLLQFKVGSGGRAQQYLGEWTKVIRPLVYRAYRLAMASRG